MPTASRMNGLVYKIGRKIAVSSAVGNLEDALAQLPLNDRKTVNGVMVTVLGAALQILPASAAPWLQPILDALHSLPAEQMTAVGFILAVYGLFHKALKVLRLYYGQPISTTRIG